jgi:hypothetical protein
MSPLYFLPNSLSDPSFEAFLQDTHRYRDYMDVKEKLLPKLFESIEQFAKCVNTRFLFLNRFEGQNPAIRIQSPAGFVPDVIYIEFPPQHDAFIVVQTAQEFKVIGLENLANHLRVLLVMGLAHWSPK